MTVYCVLFCTAEFVLYCETLTLADHLYGSGRGAILFHIFGQLPMSLGLNCVLHCTALCGNTLRCMYMEHVLNYIFSTCPPVYIIVLHYDAMHFIVCTQSMYFSTLPLPVFVFLLLCICCRGCCDDVGLLSNDR